MGIYGTAFRLSNNRVAIQNANGLVKVKQGALNADWTNLSLHGGGVRLPGGARCPEHLVAACIDVELYLLLRGLVVAIEGDPGSLRVVCTGHGGESAYVVIDASR